MKAIRLMVVSALMLAPAYALAQQPASLTGKVVMPKTSGARLASTDDQGNAVDLGELTELDYRVIADMNGRVQIKNRLGVAGWVDKNNVVSVEDAVYFYTGKIQQNANDSDAYNRRAWAWKLKGEFDIAVKDFSEALRLNPDSAIFNNRGTVHHALKKDDKALEDYSEAIRLNANFVLPYYNRAILWEGKKEYDKAIADYTEAIRIEPKYVNAYRNRGYMKYLKKEHDKAIEDFSEALRIDPRDINSYNDRGTAFHEKKMFDKAIADYSECIRIDPKYIYAHYNRGRSHDGKKEHAKAVEDYSEAIRLNPKYSIAYWGRAATRVRAKEYEKANSDYNEALKIDPKNSSLLNLAAWHFATCPDEKGRDGKRAVELAKRALELNKTSGNIMDTLAAAYAEVGDFDHAVRLQEMALQSPGFENDKGYRDRLELYKKKMPYRQPE